MRSFLLCSLVLVLGTEWTQAQQWPAFKENPQGEAASTAPYPYGQMPFVPTQAGPGSGYYPGNPYGPPNSPAFAPGNYPNSGPAYFPPPPAGYYGAGAPEGYPPGPSAGPMGGPGGMPSGIPEGLPAGPPDFYCPGGGMEGAEPYKSDRLPHLKEGYQWWVSGAYQSSWVRPGRSNTPLVTTGSTTDMAPGALGQPGTQALFGGGNFNFGMESGFRAEIGLWLDQEKCLSADLSGFYLLPSHVKFAAGSDATGNPVITRPVFDALNVQESGFIVAFPGFASGDSSARADTDMFGVEVNGRYHFDFPDRFQGELLFGYRFLRLNENLEIRDRLQPLVPGFFSFQGNLINLTDQLQDRDQFSTVNQFNGLQLGGSLRRQFGPFYWSDFEEAALRLHLTAYGKVAIGLTEQAVNINGSTTLVTPTGNQTVPGGILALSSNSGNHDRVVFGFVPEVGLNLGLEISKHFTLQGGYSFLAWNAVVRPGRQVDRNVNPSQIPSDQSFGTSDTPVRPTFAFHDEVFWVHNVFLGLEFRH